MKDFSFGMFYNETKFIQKFGHYNIAIKKKRVVNVKQFVLENKKAIIYEKNDRRKSRPLAYSYVYIKNRRGEIIPKVVGFSINKIIGEEVDNADVKTCFLKNMYEKAVN